MSVDTKVLRAIAEGETDPCPMSNGDDLIDGMVPGRTRERKLMGMKTRNKMRPVIICTEKRGVFFGYVPVSLDASESIGKPVRLEQAQMAVYWSADIGGVLGLASKGPNEACRIGPPVPAITDGPVNCIIECTEEAAEKWKAQPWK